MVTCAGKTFVSRVAGSLLRAVGLPELVTTSLEEYAEALALTLARNPEQCRGVREKLRERRLSSDLLDSALFARHLEEAYEAMWSVQ